MERDSKKRVREGDEDHNISYSSSSSSSSEKHVKTEDDPNYYHGILHLKNDLDYNDKNSSSSSSSSSCCKTSSDPQLSSGVFDFPWLKDGMISKSDDDWNFEDVFSSPWAVSIGIDDQFSFSGTSQLLELPEDKKLEEEHAWRPRDINVKGDDDALETCDEGVDCIWSSLLNQPLQQPN